MTRKLLFLILILSSFCNINVVLPSNNPEKVEPKLIRSRSVKVDKNFKKAVAKLEQSHLINQGGRIEQWFTYYEENHEYPLLPSDFCNCNVEKFVEEYQDAIDRDLNNYATVHDCGTSIFYAAENREHGLKFRLYQIKQAQRQCPKYQIKNS